MRVTQWFAFFLLLTGLANAQEPFRSAPPEEEQALKTRVDEFYTLFRQGKFRQAEQYVVEESRDLYYGAPKQQILSHQIKTVEFNPDITEASVLVLVESMMPTPLSAQALKQPLQSRWKRVDGTWQLYLKPPVNEDGSYASPTGLMQFGNTTASGSAVPVPNFEKPNLATMRNSYEVSARSVAFPSQSSEPVVKTITVKNKWQGNLTIDRYTPDFPGMVIEATDDPIPPGGESVVTFTYHPEVEVLHGDKTFDFAVMPISQAVTITLSFN